jgi:hypothetical protein
MASPKPFKISVPQEKVDALRRKLSLAQFPDELEASRWDLGSPLNDIKRLTTSWEQFEWRQAESKLNQVPQFTTDIDVVGFGPLNIHFVHQTSKASGAIPLLFVHGCKLSGLIITFNLHEIYWTSIRIFISSRLWD